MYKLTYSKKAFRQLEKLDKSKKERILIALERCRFRPYAHVKKLVNSPYFSFRVGNHRIIMDIKDDKLRIFVVEINHRKKIYKK